MDTLLQLEKLWKPKHFKHLLYCLKYCKSQFEDHFEYEEQNNDTLLIDGVMLTKKEIVAILSKYYEDNSSDYYSAFGDTLYLFFTDLVEDSVDILTELDEEVA